MKLAILSVVALVASVSAGAIDLQKRDTPLQVQLSQVDGDNSKVKVEVTNTGSQGYNLFYKGSFLDGDSPVDKFVVQGTAQRAKFNGVLLRMSTKNLTASEFVPIESGQTIETEIDVAELYDVESTDSYAVRAVGSMPYAELGTTELTGKSVAFSSNTITMDIDGDVAMKVPYAVDRAHEKRTTLSTKGCSSERAQTIQNVLENCSKLASNAASAAESGYALQEYFKTTSSSAANTIAERFRAVAQDCGSQTDGATETSCGDSYGYCQQGVLAYTLPRYNYVAYCDLFYQVLDPVSQQCHDQDQATTVLHEETHAPAVYSPGTEDYAYGYEAAQDLTSQQAINNADSYALYANALYAGCA
ncbi:Neutral protease 2-like [Pseudocercospora fuligena]|uniref:Neutral protease 2 n=1 Tax=Pseudocercospora fuligena TaxID=685502 RepID=A0A8H6RUJ0_9PEZI|nr:Neutral protease 2-like [Pseudocercospora fuligena]